MDKNKELGKDIALNVDFTINRMDEKDRKEIDSKIEKREDFDCLLKKEVIKQFKRHIEANKGCHYKKFQDKKKGYTLYAEYIDEREIIEM